MISMRRFSLAAGILSTTLSMSLLSARTARAQSTPPVCPPPAAQEFLLLVRGETEADRSKISALLPADNTVLVCQYLGETLVRAGGFTSLETANAWASYMTTVEGFESFVSKSANGAVAATSNPSSTTTNTGARYQPQRLAAGYAVLVDYGAQPEVANQVAQVVRPVGLAVYRQKPYLLAEYTNDAADAATTLQRLYDAQLSAILVDSSRVVRMSRQVSPQ